MQEAEVVLGVLRERGRKGLPLTQLYRQSIQGTYIPSAIAPLACRTWAGASGNRRPDGARLASAHHACTGPNRSGQVLAYRPCERPWYCAGCPAGTCGAAIPESPGARVTVRSLALCPPVRKLSGHHRSVYRRTGLCPGSAAIWRCVSRSGTHGLACREWAAVAGVMTGLAVWAWLRPSSRPLSLRKRITDILDQIVREDADTEQLIGGGGRQQSRGKSPVPGRSRRAGRADHRAHRADAHGCR
jgi:hypothetical protein